MNDSSWFERVQETEEETAAHLAKYGRRPSTYRYVCKRCGQRLWGSGLGIGSHVRKHRRFDALIRETYGSQTTEGNMEIQQEEALEPSRAKTPEDVLGLMRNVASRTRQNPPDLDGELHRLRDR